MQLSPSVPFPVSPDVPPTTVGAADCATVAGAAPLKTAAGPDASFASLLPPAEPVRKPTPGKPGDDAEQAAALLSASLWLPTPPVPPPPALPLATNSPAGTDDVTASINPPVLGAATSSRTFAPLSPITLPADAIALPPMAQVAAGQGANPSSLNKTPRPTDRVRPETTDTAATPVAPVIDAVTASFSFTPPTSGKTGPVALPKGPTEANPEVLPPVDATKPLDAGVTTGIRVQADAPAATLAQVESLPLNARSIPGVPVPGGSDQNSAVIAAGEKTAAPLPVAPNNSFSQNFSGKKDFLNPDPTVVTTRATGVGISVAQVSAVMPALPTNRSKPAVAAAAAPLLSVASGSVMDFAAAAPVVATVRDTMAAVVSAVEAFEHSAATAQKSVDLQFHVGDQQLGLRVELRDGTVHTTFHTDSPELRNALAHEWQAVVQTGAPREVRLADPVFNSGLTGGGDTASGSPGQGSPQSREPKSAPAAAFSLTAESAESAPVDPVRPAAAYSVTTQLLHAFA